MSGEYQSKLTLMSESLRNDGRVWVPKRKGDTRAPHEIPEDERDYYLERKYPTFGNLAPRDIASRAAKEVCDEGRGVGSTGLGVYLDFRDAIQRLGVQVILERYGNLFDMYERITGRTVTRCPCGSYPAVHYVMGGLWVDYNLESTIPGLFVGGEANFSDHGANRLGASALMQGSPTATSSSRDASGDFMARHQPFEKLDGDHPEVRGPGRSRRRHTSSLLAVTRKRTVDSIHRELGLLMWNICGMTRNEAGPKTALGADSPTPPDFWSNAGFPAPTRSLNQALEKAGRVADFLELAELICRDALHREESCGGHFREEFQTGRRRGQARRRPLTAYAAGGEYTGDGQPAALTKSR